MDASVEEALEAATFIHKPLSNGWKTLKQTPPINMEKLAISGSLALAVKSECKQSYAEIQEVTGERWNMREISH